MALRTAAPGRPFGPPVPAALHHIALRVAELERSAAFYTDVIGLTEDRRLTDSSGLRSVWLRAGDVVLMLERALRGPGAPGGSSHLLAFRVGSLEEGTARFARHGVRVDDRTAHTLYVRDPDGHRVGLSDFPFAP